MFRFKKSRNSDAVRVIAKYKNTGKTSHSTIKLGGDYKIRKSLATIKNASFLG